MYLLIGGPAHGQERALDNGQSELVVLAPSADNPLPTPFTYVLKEIEAETRPGMTFKRSILVAQGLPLEAVTQALAAVLMQRFAEELVRQYMEGGIPSGTNEFETDSTSEVARDSYPSGLLRA